MTKLTTILYSYKDSKRFFDEKFFQVIPSASGQYFAIRNQLNNIVELFVIDNSRIIVREDWNDNEDINENNIKLIEKLHPFS